MTSLAHGSNAIKIVFLLLLLYFIAGSVSAANVTTQDTVQLWVNVSELTMVDIQPDSLGWVDVPPGSETTESQVRPIGRKDAIQIENIGSTNISRIWFNASYPSQMPFGTGNPTLYDAGNFVVIRRNSTNSNYFFVNRYEYNESELIYLQLPTTGGEWSHGRFRSANAEWFWAINVSSNKNCSNSNFRIGKVLHNQTQLGSVDLQTCDPGLTNTAGGNPCREGNLIPTTQAPYTGNNQWGYSDILIGDNTNFKNYTVAVYWNCTDKVTAIFYHWNMDAPGAQEGGANSYREYFYTTDLAPGGHIIANVHLRIPYGTVAANITGALTVNAMAIDVNG